ncbi:MAG: endolytic transglycosylase MltG [Clostridia bacterium]|nr:endolytic transglycosylase MltG [Clostridia bacterium]
MAKKAKSSADRPVSGMQVYWSTVRYVGFILICAVILSTIFLLLCNDMFSFVKADANFTIVITEQNDTAAAVAGDLKTNGIINNPLFFRFYAFLTGDRKLSTGTFELSSSMGYEAILLKIGKKNAPRETVDVTVPEGYTQKEIFALLEEKGVCSAADLHKSVVEDTFSYSFLEGKTPSETWLEGYLFPDTYTFYVDDTPKRVIKKFLANFSNKMTTTLRQQAQSLGLTLEEVIIVASMVEEEARVDEDRKVIASVIYNRLESADFAHLQIDATVLYALGEHKDKLSDADLKTNSPYNTYVVEGLPKGPISNPGLNSIYAALYPATSQYYYYVARPDGSHYFAKTSSQHQANIKKAQAEFDAKLTPAA